MRPRAHISALPDDVLLLIISYVEVRDILALRKVGLSSPGSATIVPIYSPGNILS